MTKKNLSNQLKDKRKWKGISKRKWKTKVVGDNFKWKGKVGKKLVVFFLKSKKKRRLLYCKRINFWRQLKVDKKVICLWTQEDLKSVECLYKEVVLKEKNKPEEK